MKPNKSRWQESWNQIGGQVQIAKFRVMEDADYNEYHLVTLLPIENKSEVTTLDMGIRNETGGQGLLVDYFGGV